MKLSQIAILSIVSLLWHPSAAMSASPELRDVFPTGVQRGTQFELTFHGERLADAEEVLFYRPGIRVDSLVAEASKVTATCTADAACEMGEMQLRIRTRSGLTELRTIQIGALPVVTEIEPNNSLDVAQPVSLDVTIDGRITREDIDYFVVDAKKGERVTAEIEAIRLGQTMFDPYVAILDARRFELSASDDSVLLLQDSIASIIAPEDGRYYILIREASFQGSDQSHYRLHVGRYPRPRVCFPPGGRPGESVSIEIRGDVSGVIRRDVQLPATPIAAWPLGVEDEFGVAPSAVWLRVGHEIVINEVETSGGTQPNDPVAPPVAFQGILSQPDESDEWSFSASKDQQFGVRVVGREIRSPIDSVITVLGPDGAGLAASDDSNGPDSALTFTAPADGVFKVRVHDHLRRGGPLFVYRIEIAAREPSVGLSMEMMDRRRPQFLQSIDVPQGNRFAALFRITRADIGGPADISLEGLPGGVTATATPLDKDESLLPIVFSGTSDGQFGGALCPMTASIPRGDGKLIGAFEQTIPLVIGPPNEQIYYTTRVDRLAVALTERVPFRIDVVPPPVPLLRDGAATIRVTLAREEGFNEAVETRMLWNPGGVSSAGIVNIPADQSEVDYPINAAGDAPLRTHQLVVLAKAAVNGADRWVSSDLVPLEVGDRFVTGELKLCAIQREQTAGMVCNLKHVRGFEGEGTLTMRGLPPGVSTAPVTITPGQSEAIFTLSATNDAPLGRHGGLFCEFSAQVSGVTSIHRLAGGGVVRIDAKPVEVAAAAPAPAPKPEPEAPKETKPAPPKPLSRLEQLRKDAEQRRNAAATAAPEEKTEKP